MEFPSLEGGGCNGKDLSIGAGELGIVVEHFFKMGHQPFLIPGVAVKTTA